MKWIENFTGNLKEIIDKPPYLIFVFIGAVFVAISLVSKNFFEQVWIFFLYSIAGMMWRYIERDFLRKYREKKRAEDEDNSKYQTREGIKVRNREIIIFVYHVGNIGLFFILLHYLKLI